MPESFRPEIESQNQNEKVEYSEIAQLQKPIENIFRQLSHEINKGSYPLVIGIDASGRIPALIVHDALAQIYKEKGFEKPELFFCAGFQKDTKKQKKIHKIKELKEKVAQFIGQRQIDLTDKKKIFIIEDAVSRGYSIGSVALALRSINYPVEAAALGYTKPVEEPEIPTEEGFDQADKEQENFDTLGVVLGTQNSRPDIYNKPYLSGTVKDPTRVFSTGFGASVKRQKAFLESKSHMNRKDKKKLGKINKYAEGDLDGFFKEVQTQGINVARKDAHVIASRVSAEFLKNYK